MTVRSSMATFLRYMEAAYWWMDGELWWSGFVAGSGTSFGWTSTRGHQTLEFHGLLASQMDAIWNTIGSVMSIDPWRRNDGTDPPSYAAAPSAAISRWQTHLAAFAAWADTWGPNQDAKTWRSYLAAETDDQTIARFASDAWQSFNLDPGRWDDLLAAINATLANPPAIADGEWGSGSAHPNMFVPPGDVLMPLGQYQTLYAPGAMFARDHAFKAAVILADHAPAHTGILRAAMAQQFDTPKNLTPSVPAGNNQSKQIVLVTLGTGIALALVWALMG